VTVGASIGVALHAPGDAHDVDAWLARADSAMYAAKRSGKNMVELAT
jgi:diguanylate cyclase (GGDEF)-like protein